MRPSLLQGLDGALSGRGARRKVGGPREGVQGGHPLTKPCQAQVTVRGWLRPQVPKGFCGPPYRARQGVICIWGTAVLLTGMGDVGRLPHCSEQGCGRGRWSFVLFAKPPPWRPASVRGPF